MSTLPRRLALLRFSRKPPLPILRARAALWISFTALSVNGWILMVGRLSLWASCFRVDRTLSVCVGLRKPHSLWTAEIAAAETRIAERLTPRLCRSARYVATEFGEAGRRTIPCCSVHSLKSLHCVR